MNGILSAERDGPHVKFTMQLPEGYDHFRVERLTTVAGRSEWVPIHSGVHGFIEGDTDHEMAADDEPDRLGPRTYRAVAHRRIEMGSRVKVLETHSQYTNAVTV